MATTSPMIGSVMATLLQLPEGERIDAHQCQKCNAKRHERDIEHARLLNWRVPTPELHKLSILNPAPGHKEFIIAKANAIWSRAGDIDSGQS
jgi:hypothetical protein